jgi:signal transduction histidine kinase
MTIGDMRLAVGPFENNNTVVGYLLVWQSMRSINEALRALALGMLAAGIGTLVLAGLGGIVLARRALAPVSQITRTAAGISATDLSRRVPAQPAHDELGELASTFNDMIERLEAAVTRERRFTGDASHELRSPLSVIIAESSLARERRLDAAEYDRVLGVVQEQAESMQELIAALLTLARADLLHGDLEAVQLLEAVERASRQVGPAMTNRGVRLAARVPDDLVVAGQEALLTRAIRNLLDNAVNASRAGGTVEAEARTEGQWIVLRVRDHGSGIPPELWDRVFDPFFQIEAARTPGDSHGLGLSICRRLSRAHGGDVRIVPCPDVGACFEMSLPICPSTVKRIRSTPI